MKSKSIDFSLNILRTFLWHCFKLELVKYIVHMFAEWKHFLTTSHTKYCLHVVQMAFPFKDRLTYSSKRFFSDYSI